MHTTALEEAAIRVHVMKKTGGRAALSVSSTRTDQIPRLLSDPRNCAKAKRLLTLLYALCPIAHLAAYDGAANAALGTTPAERRRRDGGLLEEAVRLEAVVENLRVLIHEAAAIEDETALLGILPNPELPAPPAVSIDDRRAIGMLRGRLAQVAAAAAALPAVHLWGGAEARQIAKARQTLETVLRDASALAERLLFGAPAAEFLAATPSAFSLETWALGASATLPAAHLLASSLADPEAPEIDVPMLPERGVVMTPEFAEELAHRLLTDPGFDLAPFWQGSPRLTGAATRQHDRPAVADMLRTRGIAPATLLSARILETAALIEASRAGLSVGSTSKEAERDHSNDRDAALERMLWTYGPEPGTGISFVESARGLLVHAVKADRAGGVACLKITSPTEWQFSPNGAGQRMAGAAVRPFEYPGESPEGRAALALRIRRALFGLDACVPVDFVWNGQSKES